MNRFWQMLFGIGIVKTQEDFGEQGERPSHPKLLDWLTTEFVAGQWDSKAILRLMVTSATYRQASGGATGRHELDPENRLMSRGPRFRMPAEMLRDGVLMASGLLVPRIGGPSVKPYQPDGLWIEAIIDKYEQDHGENLFRRSLYTYWKRSVPPPNMLTFDAPNREMCTARRQRTNTPLMALVLMNDPTFVEAARGLAERVMAETGAAAASRKVEHAFRLATARRPTEVERNMLAVFFKDQLAAYRKTPDAAVALLSVGERRSDERLDPEELAAWTLVCRLILNLDETITKH